MAPEEVSLCCSACHNITASCSNDWVQFDLSHVICNQKPWYTATVIDEGKDAWPHDSDRLSFHGITSSRASCTNCRTVLGVYCRNGRGPDARRFKEHVIYNHLSIYLREIRFSQLRAPVVDGYLSSIMCPIPARAVDHRSGPEHIPAAEVQSTRGPVGSQEDVDPSAPQQAEIGTPSTSHRSLEARMLSLENSVVAIQAGLKAVSDSTCKRGVDTFIAEWEAILRAAKDARSGNSTVESLKAENEALRHGLGLQNREHTKITRAAANKASIAQRRVDSFHRRGGAPNSSQLDQGPPPQVAGLDALDQITNAMLQAAPAVQAQPAESWSDEDSSRILDNLMRGASEPDQGPDNPPHPSTPLGWKRETPRGWKRGRSAVVDIPGGLDDSPSKRRDSRATEDITPGRHQTSRDDHAAHGEVPQPTIAPSGSSLMPAGTGTVQTATDSVVHPGTTTDVDDSDSTGSEIPARVIDTTISAVAAAAAAAVAAAAVEVMPKVEEAASTEGQPQYDSVHEARILQYKARDALRKRIVTSKSQERMKRNTDAEFRKKEKIKARDRMVQELMEREEMLESEGDL